MSSLQQPQFAPLSLTGGEDFVPLPIVLSYTANDASVVASIPIINDAIKEDPETFVYFAVAGTSNLTINVENATGILRIIDNEGEPCHSVCMQMSVVDTYVLCACCMTVEFVTYFCMAQM